MEKELNQSIKQESNNNNYYIEMEDSSLIYKLRRSSQKIEQLRQQLDNLRKDNSIKSKIILNLQQKQKQVIAFVHFLNQRIQDYQFQIEDLSKKLTINEMALKESDSMMIQYSKIKQRYINCQEENIVLRTQVQNAEKEKKLLNQAFKQSKQILKQRQIQIFDIQRQKSRMSGEIINHQATKQHLQSRLQQCLSKDKEIQQSLIQYQKIITNLGANYNQTLRSQENWFNNFNQLTNTVEHIQNLRKAHRVRKGVKYVLE